MAEITLLRDDLDGGTEDVETVRFELDGVSYEIDLSASNRRAMFDGLDEYVRNARKVPKARTYSPSRGRAVHESDGRTNYDSPTAGMDKEQLRALREWARGRNLRVSDRGRIPREIVDAYNADDPTLAAKYSNAGAASIPAFSGVG